MQLPCGAPAGLDDVVKGHQQSLEFGGRQLLSQAFRARLRRPAPSSGAYLLSAHGAHVRLPSPVVWRWCPEVADWLASDSECRLDSAKYVFFSIRGCFCLRGHCKSRAKTRHDDLQTVSHAKLSQTGQARFDLCNKNLLRKEMGKYV